MIIHNVKSILIPVSGVRSNSIVLFKYTTDKSTSIKKDRTADSVIGSDTNPLIHWLLSIFANQPGDTTLQSRDDQIDS